MFVAIDGQAVLLSGFIQCLRMERPLIPTDGHETSSTFPIWEGQTQRRKLKKKDGEKFVEVDLASLETH